MNRKLKYLIAFWMVLILSVASHKCFCQEEGQKDSQQNTTPVENTQSQSTSVWSDQQWEESRKGISYKEEEKKEPEQEKKSEEKFDPDEFVQKDRFSFNDLLKSDGIKVLLIVLISALLVYIIIKFILTSRVVDSKVVTNKTNIATTIEDNLEDANLNDYLSRAIDNTDYKTAVRILYLAIIQRLNELKWIKWKKHKTNMDFLMEMREKSSFRTFRSLTLAYEIVWYGDANISTQEFNEIRKEFEAYKSTLSKAENI